MRTNRDAGLAKLVSVLGGIGVRPLLEDIIQVIEHGSDYEPKTVERTGDNRIYFYSGVDSDRCLALMQSLREIDASLLGERLTRDIPVEIPPTPIWLHILSGGGDLLPALAVADQMGKIHTPIYSIVDGACASAATIISMSCHKRLMQRSAHMLIHQISSAAWGTYEQLKDEMDFLDKLTELIVGFYTRRSYLDEETVRKFLLRDSWFGAEQCLEYGLIDEII